MREAVILAGGLGTRLRSAVPDLPKPMAPVAGRPFLELLLGSLRSKGFGRAVLSLGYMSDVVVDYFGSRYRGLELDYSIETEPLGTGGALLAAVTRCVSDHAFVFNGDTYLDIEIEELAAKWSSDQAPIIVAREVEDTSRYGRLQVDGGRVLRLDGTGESGKGLINAGCYLLPTKLFKGVELPMKFSFEQDFLSRAVQSRRFDVFVSGGKFIDIGVPDDYQRGVFSARRMSCAMLPDRRPTDEARTFPRPRRCHKRRSRLRLSPE